jgi:S-adenosylmethionine synthetase
MVYDSFEKGNFEEIKKIANSVFINLGYINHKIDVDVIVQRQSVDIVDGNGKGVDSNKSDGVIGAGDQGIMCGYAINAKDREYLPAAFWYSQQLAMKLFDASINQIIPDLFADGKTQVIIKNGKISHVTIAIQHAKEWSNKQDSLKSEIIKHVIKPIVGNVNSVIVNGTGVFEKGSIWADAGEVGRKIVIDQMGPDVPVGGGALNGKDSTKVDVTGAVMARHIAKNIVVHGLADEALVQFAFTIGQPEPDQINVYAPGWKLNMTPENWCRKHFRTSVADMIEQLELNKPSGWSYELAAKFGFYGHKQFPWERIKNL